MTTIKVIPISMAYTITSKDLEAAARVGEDLIEAKMRELRERMYCEHGRPHDWCFDCDLQRARCKFKA